MKSPLSALILITSLLTGFTSFAIQANQPNHSILSMCNYIVVDHKSKFREQLKNNRSRLKNIYSDISCNGLSLLRFAMTNNAHNVGAYIAKRLPARILLSPEADGQTIVEWANNNGKNNSPIVLAISKRANI